MLSMDSAGCRFWVSTQQVLVFVSESPTNFVCHDHSRDVLPKFKSRKIWFMYHVSGPILKFCLEPHGRIIAVMFIIWYQTSIHEVLAPTLHLGEVIWELFIYTLYIYIYDRENKLKIVHSTSNTGIHFTDCSLAIQF